MSDGGGLGTVFGDAMSLQFIGGWMLMVDDRLFCEAKWAASTLGGVRILDIGPVNVRTECFQILMDTPGTSSWCVLSHELRSLVRI